MTKDEFIFKSIKDGKGYAESLALWNQGHNSIRGEWTINIAESEQLVLESVEALNEYWGMKVRPLMSWGRSRTSSWGGYGGGKISLAMKRHVPADGDTRDVHLFSEYSSFAKSPTIGTFNGSWQDCLACLVAHEHAHCHENAVNHEDSWRDVYRWNRVTLKLNPSS